MKNEIIKACADMFGVHHRDLLGPYRFGFLMPARFALYKALRMRGLSYSGIARFMERDRTSVTHGTKRAEHMMQRDADYANRVGKLAATITIPKCWVATPRDVLHFVCRVAEQDPIYVIRTQDMSRLSRAIVGVTAKVSADAGMPIRAIARTLRRGTPSTNRVIETFDSLWSGNEDVDVLYLRAAKEFPKKDVATADCMA